MPEFLVQIEVSLPRDFAAEALSSLRNAETSRGQELLAEGVISRIWRVPGRTANVGVWSARDATELHRQIASLPMFPYLDVQVTALAMHPLEEQ